MLVTEQRYSPFSFHFLQPLLCWCTTLAAWSSLPWVSMMVLGSSLFMPWGKRSRSSLVGGGGKNPVFWFLCAPSRQWTVGCHLRGAVQQTLPYWRTLQRSLLLLLHCSSRESVSCTHPQYIHGNDCQHLGPAKKNPCMVLPYATLISGNDPSLAVLAVYLGWC